jgi:rod shape-determining protein MreD
MRFLAWFIFAYVMLGMQLGLGHYASVKGAAPNLVLLAVIFIVSHVPRDAGLLGAFSLGLVQDLLGLGPPGLYAVAYGLVALAVERTRSSVYRDHPLTHLSVALAGGLIVALVVSLHGWVRPAGPGLSEGGVTVAPVRAPVGALFLSAVYTAVLAPPLLWMLNRGRRTFSFRTVRRVW